MSRQLSRAALELKYIRAQTIIAFASLIASSAASVGAIIINSSINRAAERQRISDETGRKSELRIAHYMSCSNITLELITKQPSSVFEKSQSALIALGRDIVSECGKAGVPVPRIVGDFLTPLTKSNDLAVVNAATLIIEKSDFHVPRPLSSYRLPIIRTKRFGTGNPSIEDVFRKAFPQEELQTLRAPDSERELENTPTENLQNSAGFSSLERFIVDLSIRERGLLGKTTKVRVQILGTQRTLASGFVGNWIRLIEERKTSGVALSPSTITLSIDPSSSMIRCFTNLSCESALSLSTYLRRETSFNANVLAVPALENQKGDLVEITISYKDAQNIRGLSSG